MLHIRSEASYGYRHLLVLELAESAGQFKELQGILKCDVKY